MTITQLLEQLNTDPAQIQFEDVIQVIEQSYTFIPMGFQNGETYNQTGSNQGSCKIFYFAQLNQLTEKQTLALFGGYYRDDVLGDPEGNDHANIRNFMRSGWAGVKFDGAALIPLSEAN